MDLASHVKKAERYERTIQKLDPDDDYEMVIETCMLMGTQKVNGIVVKLGLVVERLDINHSNFVVVGSGEGGRKVNMPFRHFFDLFPALWTTVWSKETLSKTETAMAALGRIEDRRFRHVRGNIPGGPEAARESLKDYEIISGVLRDVNNSRKQQSD